MENKILFIYSDGACSGNPGPAAIGLVFKEGHNTVAEISKSIGVATNNVAEYSAAIFALQEALIRGAENIILHTDSELLFHHITGGYKVKHANLIPLLEQIRHLTRGFKSFEVKHIPRELNKEADRLAKQGIVKEQAKVVASSHDAEGRKVRAP